MSQRRETVLALIHSPEGGQHPQRVRRGEAEDVLPLRDDDERLQVKAGKRVFTSLLSRNLNPNTLSPCGLASEEGGRVMQFSYGR